MAARAPTEPRHSSGLRLLAVALAVAPILAFWPAPFVRAPGRAVCMPADPLTTRKDAFKATVVYRLGPGPGPRRKTTVALNASVLVARWSAGMHAAWPSARSGGAGQSARTGATTSAPASRRRLGRRRDPDGGPASTLVREVEEPAGARAGSR